MKTFLKFKCLNFGLEGRHQGKKTFLLYHLVDWLEVDIEKDFIFFKYICSFVLLLYWSVMVKLMENLF